MNNNIWLSGSRGFLGYYVKKELERNGILHQCISPLSGIDVIEIDFSSEVSIEESVLTHGVPETFIHMGWGNVYEPHHSSHINENLQNGIKLIDKLYELGVKRIIHIGSSSEYGDRTGALKEEYIEPLGKINNYISGKLALAKYGLEVAQKTQKHFIHVRLFYAFGSGQRQDSLINQLYKCSVNGTDIDLSPCTHYRDYIYVEDAALGIVKLTNICESGIVNMGSGSVIQMKDFVSYFAQELGGNFNLKFGSHIQPLSEQSQPKSYADLTKLSNLTNWVPSTSIRLGISKTVENMRSEDLA